MDARKTPRATRRREPARHLLPTLLALLFFAGAGPARGEEDPPAAPLLDGVATIAAPGVPGPLCAFGERAFAVVVGGKQRLPVVAATAWGRGRVVAFGHTGYFGASTLETAETGRLVWNAARWAAGVRRRKSFRVGVVGQPGLVAFLREKELEVEVLSGAAWHEALRDLRLLCLDANAVADPAARRRVARFVKRGGGLLVSSLGWGWLQLNRGKNLLEHHPGNLLLASAGLVWAGGTLDRTAPAGYLADGDHLALAAAPAALDLLLAAADGEAQPVESERAQATEALTHAIRSIPPDDDSLLPRLRRLQRRPDLALLPAPDAPLTTATPLARVLLALSVRELQALPPHQREAHAAAAAFPGRVPDGTRRVTATLTLRTTRTGEPRSGPYASAGAPARYSTGLYAAPGDLLRVEVPPEAIGKGIYVRIGAHSDVLWHKASWSRVPEITNRVPVEAKSTPASNPWGGPLYLEIPHSVDLGDLEIKVRNAVRAPLYVHGETTLEDWQTVERLHPAPWAELVCDQVALTVPSETVRELDDPAALMDFWGRVLDACADLAARPRQRAVPERYVADVQIHAGYMHSGYPIMTHLDAAKTMTDLDAMRGGPWGLFHEMGHNHQAPDWTFAGTTEVTCNLFTLYVLETVCGRERANLRKGLPYPPDRIRAYLDSGPDFGRWKRDPFLALTTYFQLVQAFGWEPFLEVFAAYRRLPLGDRPPDDDAKRDQWLVRFSRQVNRDLGPFFEAWGIPTSEAARASVENLEPWMPEGFPPE
ncbi:MAG: M60 family metallopeptidase [Planctomycetota bacterium]|jgi:hypothetical protein